MCSGSLEVDGKIVVKCPTEWIAANKAKSEEAKTARGEGDVAAAPVPYAGFDAGVELNVSKAALEPVWYLPGAFSLSVCEGGELMRVRRDCEEVWDYGGGAEAVVV